jgi:hypothetical protein
MIKIIIAIWLIAFFIRGVKSFFKPHKERGISFAQVYQYKAISTADIKLSQEKIKSNNAPVLMPRTMVKKLNYRRKKKR